MRSLALALTLVAAAAFANLRAPKFTPQSPSSALYAPATDGGLVVTSEILSLDCDRRCAVTAVYDVTSDADQTLTFEFILPVQERILAKVGKADAGVQVANAEPLTERDGKSDLSQRDPKYLTDAKEATPLYRATFDGKLVKGQNRISVAYEQLLGATEHDYGYVKDGRFLREVQYELWPIKEWTLGKGFSVTTTVAMKRAKPGFLKGFFTSVPTVSCLTGTSSTVDGGTPKYTPIKVDPVQSGDKLELRFSLRDGVPDRLHCYFGDEDLHPSK